MSRLEDFLEEKEDVFQHSGKGTEKPSSSSSGMPANAAFPSVNTGPKGVLNDYRIAKERMEKRMKEQREHDHAFVEKSTMTASTVSQDEKSKLAAKIDQMDEDELDALVAGIDAQYEAEYAGLRMKELELSDMRMKTGVALRPATGASQSSAKKFGELFELEPEALVDFVEKEDPNVLVFIHIYQKNLRPCIRLSEIMASLCKMYPHAKWARMMEDGKRDFDDDTLPILVVYKGGDVLRSHVRLVDDIGYNFDLDDVLEFLEEQKYLKSKDAIVDDS